MRFEARELKPYAEPVLPHQLEVGMVYFSVNFVDEEMLVPTVEPLVFVGRNLVAGEIGRLYFQDVASHRDGIRHGDPTDGAPATFVSGDENQARHFFEFDRALDVLMACSLRRK